MTKNKKMKFRLELLVDSKFVVTEREVTTKEHAELVAKALNEALRPDQKNLKYIVEKGA